MENRPSDFFPDLTAGTRTLRSYTPATAPGTRRRRVRPVEEDDGLDMTPMIDCTFLLLIFFMITASFHLQKGLEFPRDQSESKSTSADQLPGLGQFV